MLADDITIPKLELNGQCAKSNLGWVVRSEQLRLTEFHRNCVVQIRRGVDLDKLYHVKTEEMVSDCGNRPDKVNIEDILEGGRWHSGAPWMKMNLEEAIQNEAIKPALDLRINEEEKDDFKEGIIFEAVPEILTRGHNFENRPASCHINGTKINEK